MKFWRANDVSHLLWVRPMLEGAVDATDTLAFRAFFFGDYFCKALSVDWATAGKSLFCNLSVLSLCLFMLLLPLLELIIYFD